MKRREFVNWMTVGAIASSLPVALAACSSGNSEAPVAGTPLPVPSSAIGEAPASVAALDKAGFLKITVDGKPAIVVRDPNSKDIVAVNAMCTHKGCTVSWNAGEKAMVCPCHGATFEASGKGIKGPSEKPLARHTVKVEGDKIMVSA